MNILSGLFIFLFLHLSCSGSGKVKSESKNTEEPAELAVGAQPEKSETSKSSEKALNKSGTHDLDLKKSTKGAKALAKTGNDGGNGDEDPDGDSDPAELPVGISENFLGNQGLTSTYTLAYNAANNQKASSCSTSNLSSLTLTQACSCNVNGNCTLQLTPASNFVGLASFRYTVTVAGLASLSKQVQVNVLPDLFDNDNSILGFAGATLNDMSWVSDGVLIESHASTSAREISTVADSLPFANLRGYWKFNEGTVSTASADASTFSDSSAEENHLTLDNGGGGSTHVNGVLGNALSFDGSDDWACVSDPVDESLDFGAGDFSIVAWVKLHAAVPSGDFWQIVNKWGVSTGYGLEVNENQKFSFWIDSGLGGDTVESSTIPALGAWYHVATTRSGANIKIYVNGVLETTSSSASTANQSNGENFCVGSGMGGAFANLYADAGYDEISVWAEKLEDAEILELYKRQKYSYVSDATIADSRIFSAGSTGLSWSGIEWTPVAPYGKEFPGAGIVESEYETGNITSGFRNGLAAYWRLNGDVNTQVSTAGNAIVDLSGSSNSGTFVEGSGAASNYVSGILNSGLEFEVADRINLGNPASLQITGALTISSWVYSDFSDAGYIFRKWTGGGGYGYQLSTGTENEYNEFWFQISSDCNNTTAVKTNMNYPTGWYHVVAVYSPSTALRLYINGALVAENTSAIPASICNSTEDAAIGGWGWGGGVVGTLDEVLVWNRALSGSEVSDLYIRGSTNVKFQVRACSTSNCSGATFVGPDGTTNTYFSEILNSSANLPNFDFSPNLTGDYFQYRMIFETRDQNLSPKVSDVKVLMD